uniref:Cuticle protein 6 n=1 Tax=Daphnia galeata TaxID=27404 RepID=A0A8J2WLP0_9CRUS|nr:unnamed protein product [Daphnia galeata]
MVLVYFVTFVCDLVRERRQRIYNQFQTQPSIKRYPANSKRINMQSTIALSLLVVTVVSVCQCQLTAFHPFISAATANFAPVPVATTTWSAPSLFSMTQYHAQDELGQASYGYAYPGQAASNFRDAWGNQVGSWAYFDPEGKEDRVSYVADSREFRVLSNNLPVAPMSVHSSPLVAPVQVSDTPEVEVAKRAHSAAVAEAKVRNAAGSGRHRRSPGRYYSAASKPVAHHHRVQPTYYKYQKAATVPVVHVAAPVESIVAPPVVQQTVHDFPTFPTVHAVPVPPTVHAEVHALPVAAPVVVQQIVPADPSPIISKFHSQDELGQTAFGHVTADQSASDFRDASGNQMGHYAYINPDGQQIVVYYTAGAGGFRVISNALPEAPVHFHHTSSPAVAPAVVQDTPEVAQARREHLALVEEARNRVQSSL